MADVVRMAPLLRTCMEILRVAAEPLLGKEVLAEVERRVSLTPYEREVVKNGRRPRWRISLEYRTGDAATIGWMSKRDGRWSLTDAGELALDSYGDEELVAELKRRYGEVDRKRKKALEQLGGEEQYIARLVSVVESGNWTSFEDLAQIVGVPGDTVADFLASGRTTVPNSHRGILRADGSLPPEGMWHANYRGLDLAKKLRSEGVEFDDQGRASQDQRMTADEIKERLAELGEESTADSPTRRAWLVRGSSVDGRDLVPIWLHKSSVSLAGANLRMITPPIPRHELKAIVEDDYGHKSYAAREMKLAEFDAFCNRMRPDDYVLTTSQGKTYVGRVIGEATYVTSSDSRSNLRRIVEWLNPTAPVPFAHIPQPLPAKLHSQSDVVELTEDVAAIEELLTALGIAMDQSSSATKRELWFPEITQELADELLIGRDWLQRQVDLLWDRKQMIFYGPPGTGKTYIARKLAGHVAEPSAVKLVQFHPSYTYEDFFEGFRPKQRADGQLEFELRPGPFRKLVEAARQHPSDPYILIIDEINRANLAKVFGELYFLLEYRDDAISLLYSEESEFTLPPNVFVIGTMNTTDRSIALVDAAMRRRFAFVELHPAKPPTAGLLKDWLGNLRQGEDLQHNLDAPALLDALNARIDEHDLAIGPSYFMHDDIYRRDDGLQRVWETSILPLLAEHHYGSPPEVLDQYRLDVLRKAIVAQRTAE